jgi:hypothetical protein
LTDDQTHDLIRRWLETEIEQAKLLQPFKAANFLSTGTAHQHDGWMRSVQRNFPRAQSHE